MSIKSKRDLSYTNSVAQLKNRVAVPDYYFKKLPQESHALAFYVSEMTKVEQVQAVLDSLQDATEKGLSFKEWQNRMQDEGIAFNSKAQQMAVFRNNTNNVYNNSTRFNALSSGVTPYLVVDAVGDSRTRPDHLKMDGVCARADSKIWDYYLPPFEHGCRCRVRAVTESEAKAIGIRHSIVGLPKFRFSKKPTSYGNILAGAMASITEIKNSLPKNSPLRSRFAEKILGAWEIADMLVEKNMSKFLKGF